MTITTVFAGIPVSDYHAARAWYERLFGRPADMLPHDTEAVWHLSETGLVYVVANRDRAGTALLTLIVDDLDGLVAELAGRGLTAGEPYAVGSAARKADISDPEGNLISFAELTTND